MIAVPSERTPPSPLLPPAFPRARAPLACPQGVTVNCGLLTLATITVVLPSLLSETKTEVATSTSELILSRFESVWLLACYLLYLFFQLVTHT